jgi:hypothetical protein
MPLWPDIVVAKPDSSDLLLVVEIKGHKAGLPDAETQLKAYMAHTSCPAGMLVTPETIRFYRNRYTHHAPQSVEVLGECGAFELLGSLQPQMTEVYLEERVGEWLESLQRTGNRTWPSSVRGAVEECVVPAVLGGVIRVGGPRLRKTGS